MDKNTLTIFRPVLDEPTVSGITEDGEEILKKPLSYQTKFDQNVAKIDFSSLLISEESKKSSSTATTTNNSQEAPAPLYVPTVEQVKQHIYYAYEEIRLTLDLVEGLLEDAKGISNPSTPKFLKLLAAPRRPPPRPQQHIQELQINISAKFEDLNFVSRHLEDAANRFDLLLNQDDAFYGKFAPSLRVHGWILQAHAARGLYVDYGFGNEWSALQPHYAEVNRDVGPAGKTSAEAAATLEVFHKQRKTVRIKLSDPDSAAQGETLQDFWARWSSTDEDEPPLNDLLNRLKQAQASLFEEGEFEILSKDTVDISSKCFTRILPEEIIVSTNVGNKLLKASLSTENFTTCGAASPDIAAHRSFYDLQSATLELIAQQRMRERQRVPSTRQKRGTRTLLNSLLQKVQLRDRQQVIQTTLQKAFKGLHRRCELSVKVTSGAQSNERKFFISIFNRPAITLTLDETSLVAFSAINMLEMQITLHGLEEYLLLQIWQVCMHQVADEANMLGLASGSAAGSKLWRPNFFIMEGVIRTAKLPFRCSVYCVGSDISSSYLEFVYLQKRVKVPLATPDNVAQWRTLRGDIQDALLTAKNAVNPNEDWSEVLGL